MPTENEIKIVLRPNTPSAKVAGIGGSNRVFTIRQGYLIATRGITVRVRSMSAGKGEEEYYFTLKVNTNGRVIEIENPIDRRDFDDLWDISLNKLEKVRYKLNGKYKGWEVDFFRDHDDQIYFVMAECEMPEGQIKPTDTPPQIKEAMIYEVPLNDVRFSSKLLSDVRYAKRLLTEISQ